MKVLIILFFAIIYLQANMLGVWTIESNKDSEYVEFGKETSENRGTQWKLQFLKNRTVVNISTGEKYGFYMENNVLNLYKRSVSQTGGKYLYSTITKIRYKSKIIFMRNLTGMYNGCILVKIKRDIFSKYKSKRKFRMCKIQNESLPVYNSKSSTELDIFH
jgi:hypothetical protein